ncbi:MAG TPA: M23 family metallopeptidase [Vicinamibacterales bacterium]|nr:M23 family metallopeptidase [Vicinamibacterales bacterium]
MFRATALLLTIVCGAGIADARSQGRPLKVSFTPATLQPGDVARIEIAGLDDSEQISATLLDQDLAFHFDEMTRTWRALSGVDLDRKPAAYQLRIRRGGSTSIVTRTVRVVPKSFRVRRLRVSGEFVDPPAEALAQIAEDSAVLADAYARVSPKKWTGSFVLPVDGQPSSNFGTRSYYNGQRRSPHAGVDFVGEPGTPIRAANHGEVIVARSMYFTGNTIVVDYGDRLFSVFAHLSAMHVKAGDIVEPATIVGLVGATGRVTGPHLHWSVRLNGARVDPLSLIAATK